MSRERFGLWVSLKNLIEKGYMGGHDIGNIENITRTLDKILRKTNWNSREYHLYQALLRNVQQYRDRAEIYELNRDKIPIIENVKERQWYLDSNHQPLIKSLLENMSIRKYQIQGQPPRSFVVELSIYFYNQYRLNLWYRRDTILEFYTYLESLNAGVQRRGYIANNAPQSNPNSKGCLPEFDQIYEIMKLTPLEITKRELLHLVGEIIIYFDETQTIMETPLGETVNVTLGTILKTHGALRVAENP